MTGKVRLRERNISEFIRSKQNNFIKNHDGNQDRLLSFKTRNSSKLDNRFISNYEEAIGYKRNNQHILKENEVNSQLNCNSYLYYIKLTEDDKLQK